MDDEGVTIQLAGGHGEAVLLTDDDVQPWTYLEDWVRTVGEMVAVQVEAYRDARPWEVVVRLASDDTVRGLNATFRHKDKPTNVLSFPNEDDGLEARWTVGDIVLAQSVVEAEAADQHKPLANHARHLLLHGLLHLVGYDHMTDDDARTMEVLEARLLATLGIPNPYAGDKT